MARNMTSMNEENLLSMGAQALMSGQVTPEEVMSAEQALAGTDTGALQSLINPGQKNPYIFDGPKASVQKRSTAPGKKDEKRKTESKTQSQTRSVFLEPEQAMALGEQGADLPGVREQRESIALMEDLLNMQLAQPADSSDAWIRPLLSLASAETGKNLLAGYQPPENQGMKNQRYLAGLDDLQKRKGDLSKTILDSITKMKAGSDTTQATQGMQNTIAMLSGALAGKGGNQLDPFTKAETTVLGKASGQWVSLDRSQVISNMNEVRSALADMDKMLSEGQSFSGRKGQDWLPESLRTVLDSRSRAIEQKMQSAIQMTLRPTLGAQFTQKEGERIMALKFDPLQSPAENRRRAAELEKALRESVKAKDALFAYLRNNRGDATGFDWAKYGLVPEESPDAYVPGRVTGSSSSDGSDLSAKQKRLEELRAKQRGG